MSPRTLKAAAKSASRPGLPPAPVITFAALGDPTRLALIARLSRGQRCSIAQLTHGSHLTRQAITKHLRVLKHAHLVRCLRSGRESLFELDPAPMRAMRDYLDQVSAQWDQALTRLKSLVEETPPRHDRSR
jgi:DNA-binding transcriptional ArsR family regulator